MKDDYTTNSHYFTSTLLFGKVGSFELGSERVKPNSWCKSYSTESKVQNRIHEQRTLPADWGFSFSWSIWNMSSSISISISLDLSSAVIHNELATCWKWGKWSSKMSACQHGISSLGVPGKEPRNAGKQPRKHQTNQLRNTSINQGRNQSIN